MSKPTARTRKLESTLRQLSRSFGAVSGVCARRLDTGESVGLQADREFPTASSIKIVVLLEVLRQVDSGRLSWTRRYTHPGTHPGGSGVLRYLTKGLRPTLGDLATLMMCVSDNQATNVLVRAAGLKRINANLLRHGIEALRINHPIDISKASRNPRHLAEGSPRAFVELLEKLVRGELLSRRSTAMALRIMRIQTTIELIRRHLPYNPYDPIDDNPKRLWVASKPGGLTGCRCEAGIIHLPGARYIVLAVMTEHCKDNRFSSINEANGFVAACSREIWKAWK